jgi:hypothetical protein
VEHVNNEKIILASIQHPFIVNMWVNEWMHDLFMMLSGFVFVCIHCSDIVCIHLMICMKWAYD